MKPQPGEMCIVVIRYDARDVEAYGPFANGETARAWVIDNDNHGEVIPLRIETMTPEAFDMLKESLP